MTISNGAGAFRVLASRLREAEHSLHWNAVAEVGADCEQTARALVSKNDARAFSDLALSLRKAEHALQWKDVAQIRKDCEQTADELESAMSGEMSKRTHVNELVDRDARITDLEARLAVATHWRGNLATIIRLRSVVDAAVGWVADDESGDLNSSDQGSARLHNAVRAYQVEEKKAKSLRGWCSSEDARRPAPVKLCSTCDGKKTLGSWDGKGGFTYATCSTCKGDGILVGPEWGVCQYCKKQLSFAHNCCTSCADERGP